MIKSGNQKGVHMTNQMLSNALIVRNQNCRHRTIQRLK